jgi:translation elongation factor EF-G
MGMLEGITFAKPVITMAIEPKSNQDKEKLAYALAKMEREDPTFKKWVDPETAQLIIAGMGELHLEVLQHRMLDDFKVDAVVGKPRVSYRQTITKAIEIRGKHVKQSGGRGQYGDCVLEIRPLTDEEKKAGNEFLFVNGTRGGSVPKEYVGPIEDGVRNELARGYELPYPCINVHVTLVDGSYHDVDSSEHAFVAAGQLAIRLAYPEARSPGARAVDARRGGDARRIHRLDHGLAEFQARDDHRDREARSEQHHPLRSAAGRDVRLHHGPALHEPGPCVVLDGTIRVQGSPQLDAREAQEA